MTSIFLQQGESSREAMAAWSASRTLGVPLHRITNEYLDVVPVGDVQFCENVMAHQGIAIPQPDFYPVWLSHWMHRGFAIRSLSEMPNERATHAKWFVKSADEYKAYPARVYHKGDRWPDDGRFIISEVVTFTQEWRYYVADGEVVTTGWYAGDEWDAPAPDLGIDWPAGFCGAVDFGRLDTGELALVECHHPYAAGWYGDDHELYLLWLIAGFEYLKRGCNGR